jgi:propanol-preferring alcohol dehydrogenase
LRHLLLCRAGCENPCDAPLFTGYTRDGGFATKVVADASFAFDLDPAADAVSLASLLCAGLIGWRSLKRAGNGRRISIYGFGAAAHITQICTWVGREVYAFTKLGDLSAQRFALRDQRRRALGRRIGAEPASLAGRGHPSPMMGITGRRRRAHA